MQQVCHTKRFNGGLGIDLALVMASYILASDISCSEWLIQISTILAELEGKQFQSHLTVLANWPEFVNGVNISSNLAY